MPSSERRRFPRFPFHSQGALSLAGQVYEGTLLDVSLKGALFMADSHLGEAAGHMGCLEIFDAGQPGFCSATALVAHHQENLVGLEFVDLNDGIRQLLTQVINMNLAVDTLLERDLLDMLGVPGGK